MRNNLKQPLTILCLTLNTVCVFNIFLLNYLTTIKINSHKFGTFVILRYWTTKKGQTHPEHYPRVLIIV